MASEAQPAQHAAPQPLRRQPRRRMRPRRPAPDRVPACRAWRARRRRSSRPRRTARTPARPSAGPIARAAFQLIEIAVIACGRNSRGIVSPMVEFHAGSISAKQQPATKISSRIVAGPAQPASISALSTTTDSACTISGRADQATPIGGIGQHARRQREQEHRQEDRGLHQCSQEVRPGQLDHQPGRGHGLHRVAEIEHPGERPQAAERGVAQQPRPGRHRLSAMQSPAGRNRRPAWRGRAGRPRGTGTAARRSARRSSSSPIGMRSTGCGPCRLGSSSGASLRSNSATPMRWMLATSVGLAHRLLGAAGPDDDRRDQVAGAGDVVVEPAEHGVGAELEPDLLGEFAQRRLLGASRRDRCARPAAPTARRGGAARRPGASRAAPRRRASRGVCAQPGEAGPVAAFGHRQRHRRTAQRSVRNPDIEPLEAIQPVLQQGPQAASQRRGDAVGESGSEVAGAGIGGSGFGTDCARTRAVARAADAAADFARHCGTAGIGPEQGRIRWTS